MEESILDSEEKPSKRQQIKELLYDKSVNTTGHGLPRILESENLAIKIMWGIFLLGSIGFCAWLIARSLIDYLEFGVVTNAAIVQEAPLDFPAVTICNLNPFVTPFATNYILEHFNKITKSTNFTNLSQVIDYYSKDYTRFYYEMEILRHGLAGKNDSFKKQFGYSLEDMVLRCQYNNKPCNMQEFDWYYNPVFGNCYRFNMGLDNDYPINQALYAGETYGLKLELFVGLQLNNTFSYQTSTGIRLFIQNQSIVPLANEGLTIQAGKASILKLNKVLTTNVPNPYSNCREIQGYDSILTKYIQNTGNTYRYKYCMTLCLQMLVIDECSCYSLEEPYFPTEKSPCYLDTYQYACYVSMYRQFSDLENNLNCTEECPIECEMENYNLDQSLSDYPSRAFAQELIKAPNVRNVFEKYEGISAKDLNYTHLKLGTASASIYFDDLVYTTIDQSIKTTEVDLIANLGGQLGLFIGVSILSFGEIVEFFVEAYYILLKD